MRGDQVQKSANEFDISLASAIRMRTRYLVQVISDWEDYIEEKTDVVPPSTIGIAFNEIHELRQYEARAKKGPVKGAINDDMVQRAREYPITNLFEFVRGRTQCPFHNSKGPDLSYHAASNTVRCFGACGKSWDTLGVLMERDGWNFIEAVKYLCS